MKKAKLAASLIAVSLAATTLLTGCNNNSSSGSGSGSGSGNSGSGSGNSDSGSGSGNSDSGNSNSGTVNNNPAFAENLPFNLTYPDGTTIRMAVGYNGPTTGIEFDASTVGEGGLKLADGKTYTTGMLKPTWQTLSDTLKVTFNNKYSGAKSASDEFDNWKAQFDQVDIVTGSASKINEEGAAGNIVDLADYLNDMPNFQKFLNDNPIVRMSITGYKTDNTLGAIYFAPYFDGVDDIERMPLMRTDWVEKLLNGSGDFTATDSLPVTVGIYTPYMPTEGSIDIEVVKKDGSGTETIKKDYTKYGNIVKKMNEAGSMTGVEAVNMLRKYIDDTYSGYYGNNRADLFIGQNAAWDADELVALLRCVVNNPQTLNGTTTPIQGIFARDNSANNRKVDTYKFAGHLFGARGMESRMDYLYVGNDKKLHDARSEAATYEALEKMNQMAKEGLIGESYKNNDAIDTKKMLEGDLGFMHYDYNQTQTAYNDGKTMTGEEKYRAVMVPVAKWYDDGTSTPKYFRFAESWRSVKDSGWCIPKATESNKDVLYACLHLLDYAYSADGQILLSYGPDAWIDVKDASKTAISEKYNTYSFNGYDMPKMSEAAKKELWDLKGGNYTNYARQILGSTLHFVKSQAFEVECTTDVGKEGANILSTAIGLGVIKHPSLSTSVSNPWYISVPTVLPVSKEDKQDLAALTKLGTSGAFNTGSSGLHVFVDMIIKGYEASDAPGKTAQACADTVMNEWGGSDYLNIRNAEWEDILGF